MPSSREAVAGDIAAMGLQDWWFSTFSEPDREWMADTFMPLRIAADPSTATAHVISIERPLVDGSGCGAQRGAFKHLSLLATWFSRPGYAHLALAFLEKSMEFIDSDTPILDRHFALADHCKVFYRWRDSVPGAFENAIKACEMCIDIHEQAAVEAKEFFGMVPSHACFRQLRIIEEKRGNLDRAIALCEQAKAGGWADDWDKDIARLTKKKAKAEKERINRPIA
jgi:hypothetical protein